MTLVVTFAPYEDESGFGYYRRLASRNTLLGWRELAALASIAPSRSALMGRPEHLAAQLGLKSAWSRLASLQEAECRRWRGLRRTGVDAVCPECLNDEVYLRRYWEHSYATACPLHRMRLIDQCPGCTQSLSTGREEIEYCSCGYDLRVGKSSICSESQQWLSALIASNGAASGGIQPRLQRVDVSALCELVRTLCLYENPSSPPPRRSTGTVRRLSEATAFLEPLGRLLFDWPRGFAEHAEERISAANPRARTLNSLLGQWYVRLRKACEGSSLEPFLRILIEVAARNFDGALGLDSAKQVAAEATAHTRAPDAAKRIGVSRDRIIEAAKRGEIAYRTRRLGTRGLVYEIPTAEVDRVCCRRQEWISARDACKVAGVPLAVMQEMLAAQVVEADAKWQGDLLKGGLISKKSLQELFERIRGLVPAGKQGDDDCLLWSELTSRRMGDKRAIRTVMRAAASGELVGVLGGPCLGQIGFLKSAVVNYFGTPVLEAGMSVQSLSKATGWKWESISHWISIGLLESERIVLRGQTCRVITPHALLSFRRRYLPLADLAKAMGTTPSALAKELSDLAIVGAKELPNGRTRGGLVRIGDLGRMAVAGHSAVQAECEPMR